MKDREFLIWLHQRLTTIGEEHETADYLHKLRAIIRATKEDKYTPSTNTCNSLEELMKEL